VKEGSVRNGKGRTIIEYVIILIIVLTVIIVLLALLGPISGNVFSSMGPAI
jgi:hypothetical protein